MTDSEPEEKRAMRLDNALVALGLAQSRARARDAILRGHVTVDGKPADKPALTVTPEAVEAMIKAFRIYSRKVPLDGGGYIMDHTASIYLLNSDAVFTGTIDYQ